ncbi:hypothetical protein B5F40_09975 [Gordonibacter sp. An230]|uniref:helix-turn-helix transcriptional regulator n=1 Tax=Gordonibacter sp. An230 TaxID=1965592 RepID=UPI000B37002A|nr:helix-turn-helix transcriptional regulator [Gordonibacter sp. An230]OUO89708.1 hypothetical protein B5F40_09975 [Gordonibacter sp. An230]
MPDGSIRGGRGVARVRACACGGYALLSFACQLAVWGGLRLSERTGLDVPSILTWWTVPLLIGMAVVLSSMGAAASLRASRGKAAGAAFRALPFGFAMLAVAGYGLVAAAPSGLHALVGAGAALTGAGMGGLSALWAHALSRLGACDVPRLVLWSVVVCAALSLATEPLALPALEFAYAAAACGSAVLLAVVSAACGRSPAPAPVDDGGEAAAGAPRAAGGLAREALGAVRTPLFCAAAIAFAVAVTRTMTLRTQLGMVGTSGVACMAVGAVALLAMLRGPRGRRVSGPTIPALFRILFPVVATLLLALSVGGERLAVAVGAAVFAAYSLMQALMVPACIDAARQRGVRSTTTYGLFAGAVYAVFAASTWIGLSLFSEGGGFGATASLTAALLVLYVLSMAYALVQRRAGMSVAEGAGDSSAGAGEGLGSGSADGSAKDRMVAPSCGRRAAIEPAESDAGPRGSAGTSPLGLAAALRLAAEAVPDEPDPICRRCFVLAERFALSPRETDVLVAFAHGRNVSYLAERLCLSPNTIRTHSKTLYAKLGVHSKQELLNLVDEVEQPRAKGALESAKAVCEGVVSQVPGEKGPSSGRAVEK